MQGESASRLLMPRFLGAIDRCFYQLYRNGELHVSAGRFVEAQKSAMNDVEEYKTDRGVGVT
jgi:hypothetical protein